MRLVIVVRAEWEVGTKNSPAVNIVFAVDVVAFLNLGFDLFLHIHTHMQKN